MEEAIISAHNLTQSPLVDEDFHFPNNRNVLNIMILKVTDMFETYF